MAPAIHVEQIGEEGEPVVVIDNFSPHPERLVADAASVAFAVMGEFYPGVRAAVLPSYFEGLDRLLAAVMHKVFGYHAQVSFTRALYSLVTTPPADLTLAQRIPHFDDVEEGRIAILHYLTQQDRGGTSFYRHRSTGFETVDAARHEAYLAALKTDFARAGEPPPGYIAGDTPIFERIASFAPAWNRALIYRSSLLHCAAVPDDLDLSPDAATGRLTVASFLEAR